MYGDYLKPDGWGLQLGTFSSVDNALAFCQKVKESGYSKLFIQQIPVGSGYTYKVVLGAYSTVEMARSYEAEVKKKGYDSFAIAHLP
ncbi:MAG: SPOR domain-containing protein [Bacteroidetes bacterium]|nr:SPOR domain-containing protein [Bacteroidota bacterium]